MLCPDDFYLIRTIINFNHCERHRETIKKYKLDKNRSNQSLLRAKPIISDESLTEVGLSLLHVKFLFVVCMRVDITLSMCDVPAFTVETCCGRGYHSSGNPRPALVIWTVNGCEIATV